MYVNTVKHPYTSFAAMGLGTKCVLRHLGCQANSWGMKRRSLNNTILGGSYSITITTLVNFESTC